MRWVGDVVAPKTGVYTFTTTTDDGVRLWVNDQPVIHHWNNQAATNLSGSIFLTAGQPTPIRMEYYENGGQATAKLKWSSTGLPLQVVPAGALRPTVRHGLDADYFDGPNSDTAELTRLDPTVSFDWGLGAPDPALPTNGFAARWNGKVVPIASETYTFTTYSDDGVRVWVNGQQVINNWTNHGVTVNSGHISLTAGHKYDIRVDYYEDQGLSQMQLFWQSPSTHYGAIPQSQLLEN